MTIPLPRWNRKLWLRNLDQPEPDVDEPDDRPFVKAEPIFQLLTDFQVHGNSSVRSEFHSNLNFFAATVERRRVIYISEREFRADLFLPGWTSAKTTEKSRRSCSFGVLELSEAGSPLQRPLINFCDSWMRTNNSEKSRLLGTDRKVRK